VGCSQSEWCEMGRTHSTATHMCRGPGPEPAQTDAFIAHMLQCLELPHGVAVIDAHRGPAATGTAAPVRGAYGLAFKVKVCTSGLTDCVTCACRSIDSMQYVAALLLAAIARYLQLSLQHACA
jgi:hypothetical protein